MATNWEKLDLAEKIEQMWDDSGLTLYSFCKRFDTIEPRQIKNLVERETRPSRIRVVTAMEIMKASRGKITWKDFTADINE